MRRIIIGTLACLTFTSVLLTLPVYAAPLPKPVPVKTAATEVEMGSIAKPAAEADVQAGTTEPTPGVPDAAPALTVSQSGDRFSMVGVTWALDPGVTDVMVQIRAKHVGGEWGDWTAVSTEGVEQNQTADNGRTERGGTSPLWTGPSTAVEAEVVTRSGATPHDVKLDLIDPGASRADSALKTPAIQDKAGALASMPDVFSRQQWGADESIRTWDPEYAPTIKAATIHHTADSNDYTADQVPSILRSIYRYHTVSLGWGDIGYNVIADKFGRLWEGRYGGLSSTVIGAHAGGFNTGTFGVSMLGNYDIAPTTQPMIESVAAIVAWKLSLYGVNPNGTTRLTSSGGGTAKYAAGTTVTLPTIFAHRDVGATLCPGQYGYAKMGEIRTRVAALMGSEPVPVGANRFWELRGAASSGAPSTSFYYGTPGATTLACDFNGDGRDDIAVFDKGTWAIRLSVSSGAASVVFSYGGWDWTPVCGDWDGDGKAGIGVYDPWGTWYLRDLPTAGLPDKQFAYGWSGTTPVVGDWDGNGTTTVGVFDPAASTWLPRNSNSAGVPATSVQYGYAGVVPVTGDWDGDRRTDMGLFDRGTWLLRTSLSYGPPTSSFGYGAAGDAPTPGNWNGSGSDGIGVTRRGVA